MNSGHVMYLTERYCLFNSSPWELEIQGRSDIDQRPLRQIIKEFEEMYVRFDAIKVRGTRVKKQLEK